MAQLKIKNLTEGYQSIISNGRHSIVGDEPIRSKGTDLGLSPTELVLAGIGMCKVATVRNVARRNGWDIGEVHGQFVQRVRRSPDGGLLTKIDVEIDIEGEITEEQRNVLLYEADHCYVHRMIEGDWDIRSSIPTTAVTEIA